MEPAVPNGAAAEPAAAAAVVREQDRLMPIANVIRIMRRVLPPHAKISDDAKELIQECVSEFISFVTGEANERCHGEHRKTVTAEDVVWAMDRLGFDDYVMPLSVYLQRMRDCEGGGGGDHRAVQRTPPAQAHVYAHGVPVQVQMRQAHVYAHPAPAQAYAAVAMPPVRANALTAPHVGGVQYEFGVGGQRSAAPPYYGEVAPYGAGGGRGGCGDEASSSSAAPAPAVGTGSQ